jgi:hypothetical protein
LHEEAAEPDDAAALHARDAASSETAAIDKYVRPSRPFHHLRHASLMIQGRGQTEPVALISNAGHSSMQTTGVYTHLAGQVVRDEADAMKTLLGGTSFYPPEPISPDLRSPDVTPEHASAG